MPSFFEQSQAFRRELLLRDAAAAEALTRAYGEIYLTVQGRVAELVREIEEAAARGEVVNAYWLAQRDRLSSLLRQVEAEVRRFSYQGEALVRAAQAEAVSLARSQALTLVTQSTSGAAPFFARLPSSAVEDVVGFLSPGRPLRALVDGLAGSASERVRHSLITAVATGQTPRRVATEIRESLGGNLTDALTLSRTSIVNAYRTSTLRMYRANSDVVTAWRWVAAKSARTCIVCLALDGTVWPLEEPMPAHMNCRCVMTPVIDGAGRVRRDTGAEWFEKQPDETKRKLLGAGRFELYKSGKVGLRDFVGQRPDRYLGEVSHRLSLNDLRKRQAA